MVAEVESAEEVGESVGRVLGEPGGVEKVAVGGLGGFGVRSRPLDAIPGRGEGITEITSVLLHFGEFGLARRVPRCSLVLDGFGLGLCEAFAGRLTDPGCVDVLAG